MLVKKSDIPKEEELDPMGGSGHLLLEVISGILPPAARIDTLARATLAPGAEVGYHLHETDSELYYFLRGEGEYTEGDVHCRVGEGDATYTPVGGGHGIRNVGDGELEFIALSLLA